MLVLPVNVEIIVLGSLQKQINSFEALLILMYEIKIIQHRQCHDVLETVDSVIREKNNPPFFSISDKKNLREWGKFSTEVPLIKSGLLVFPVFW